VSVFCVLRTVYRLKYVDQAQANMSSKDDEEKYSSRSDQVDLYNGEGDNVAPRWFIVRVLYPLPATLAVIGFTPDIGYQTAAIFSYRTSYTRTVLY